MKYFLFIFRKLRNGRTATSLAVAGLVMVGMIAFGRKKESTDYGVNLDRLFY